MPADAELSNLLNRRQRINDELEEGKDVKKEYKFVNVFTEFHELTRREIKQYEQTFNRWEFDTSVDKEMNSFLFLYFSTKKKKTFSSIFINRMIRFLPWTIFSEFVERK